jgi:uncharacterized membrane protein
VQNRVADAITRFAGSMVFADVHVLWFGVWIGLRVEGYPFGLLTMIVSLEAIFLSTFILVSPRAAVGAPGRIRTCAPGSGGRCSIP